jgi:NADPH:quinone reductase-like Zn-dependent oxidoreductase
VGRGGESPTAQCTITTTAGPNRFHDRVTAMRAFVLRGGFGLDHLTHEDRPDPAPGPGQVLVRVRAASLNYRDLLVARGEYNPKLPLPRVLGSDAAGEVVAVGEGVKKW